MAQQNSHVYRVETVIVVISHIRASSQEEAEHRARQFTVSDLWERVRAVCVSRWRVLPGNAPETVWWRA